MRRSYKAIRVMLMAALLVGSTAVAQAAGYKYGDKGGDIVDLQKSWLPTDIRHVLTVNTMLILNGRSACFNEIIIWK